MIRRRGVLRTLPFWILIVLAVPRPARADNCADTSDCLPYIVLGLGMVAGLGFLGLMMMGAGAAAAAEGAAAAARAQRT